MAEIFTTAIIYGSLIGIGVIIEYCIHCMHR
jgi:hypothetical protein